MAASIQGKQRNQAEREPAIEFNQKERSIFTAVEQAITNHGMQVQLQQERTTKRKFFCVTAKENTTCQKISQILYGESSAVAGYIDNSLYPIIEKIKEGVFIVFLVSNLNSVSRDRSEFTTDGRRLTSYSGFVLL